MKECAMCHLLKDESEFSKTKSSSDGLHVWCRPCCKVYKDTHKEETKRSAHLYKVRHPQRYWAHSSLANHRWGKGKYDCRLSLDELEQFAKDHPKCAICGRKVKWIRKEGVKRNAPDAATLDRIDNEKIIDLTNIQILCYRCNTTKSNRTMAEFIEYCKMVVRRMGGSKCPA